MELSKVEVLFSWLDQTTNMLEQHLHEPYLECLAVTMDVLSEQQSDGNFDELTTRKLQTALKEINIDDFKQDDIRKAVQLAMLKGMKDATQQQHMMTPDSVALFVGYLAQKLTKDKQHITIFDPASGTGNLLTTVISQLDQSVSSYGSEIDPTLIRLSVANANLQQMEIEFFHQDSLRPFLLDPVDLVVTDLPVGYYPDDVRANKFTLKKDEGHSYAHHLFIEQSLTYTKEAGYLIFIIPNFLFDSDESEHLQAFLREHAHIIGLIQLPSELFTSEKHGKSIFIIQKKGEKTNTLKQPLLVKLPSFKNSTAMDNILGQMNVWFSKFLKR